MQSTVDDDEDLLFGHSKTSPLNTCMQLMVLAHERVQVEAKMRENMEHINRMAAESGLAAPPPPPPQVPHENPAAAAPHPCTQRPQSTSADADELAPHEQASAVEEARDSGEPAPRGDGAAETDAGSDDPAELPSSAEAAAGSARASTDAPTIDAGALALARRAYKHIALHCHPDKTQDVTRHAIFRKARQGLDKRDSCQVLLCMARLAVMGHVMTLTADDQAVVQRLTGAERARIAKSKQSVAYLWDTLPAVVQRDTLRSMLA